MHDRVAALLGGPAAGPLAPHVVAAEHPLDVAEVVRQVVLGEQVHEQRAAHPGRERRCVGLHRPRRRSRRAALHGTSSWGNHSLVVARWRSSEPLGVRREVVQEWRSSIPPAYLPVGRRVYLPVGRHASQGYLATGIPAPHEGDPSPAMADALGGRPARTELLAPAAELRPPKPETPPGTEKRRRPTQGAASSIDADPAGISSPASGVAATPGAEAVAGRLVDLRAICRVDLTDRHLVSRCSPCCARWAPTCTVELERDPIATPELIASGFRPNSPSATRMAFDSAQLGNHLVMASRDSASGVHPLAPTSRATAATRGRMMRFTGSRDSWIGDPPAWDPVPAAQGVTGSGVEVRIPPGRCPDKGEATPLAAERRHHMTNRLRKARWCDMSGSRGTMPRCGDGPSQGTSGLGSMGPGSAWSAGVARPPGREGGRRRSSRGGRRPPPSADRLGSGRGRAATAPARA